MPRQPLSQLIQGGVASRVGPPAQLIDVVTVGQPVSQEPLGHLIPVVGQRTDDLDGLLSPGPVRQPAGQLPPGMLIPGLGPLAQLPVQIVLGQLVSPPPPFRVLRGIAHWMGHRHSLAKVMIPASANITPYADSVPVSIIVRLEPGRLRTWDFRGDWA